MHLRCILDAFFTSMAKVVWDVVKERFFNRLALWKRQYLSKEGRITLLNSTLNSLPIYFLSLFVIPKSVAKTLEKIQRDLLWGGVLEKKSLLVNWSIIYKDKKGGGLSIKYLSTISKAFLGKWCWRFTLERDMLWRKFIMGKFGEEVGALKKGEKVVEWACGSQIEKNEEVLEPRQDLRLETREESNFGMTCVVMIYL